MAKRRAPGGGRKSKGPTVPFSMRVPVEMRDELSAAATKRSKQRKMKISDTEEMLIRLRTSFARERDEARDPAMRALGFLFAEAAEQVHLGVPWRSDPFLYRAVKIAISRLLDALEPKGRVKASKQWKEAFAKFAKERIFDGRVPLKAWIDQFSESPEALAKHAVSTVLVVFNRTPMGLSTMKVVSYDKFGIEDARRDLQIKTQGEKS